MLWIRTWDEASKKNRVLEEITVIKINNESEISEILISAILPLLPSLVNWMSYNINY